MTAFVSSLRSIRPFPVISGEWPTNRATLVPSIAVNRAAAQLGVLTLRPTPGVAPMAVTIAAVVEDGQETPQAWLPLQQLRIRAGADPDAALQIIARDPGHDESIGSRLDEAASLCDLRINEGAQRVDIVETLASTLDTMRATFLGVGAVTLFVGVIGILNIGLATIHERAEEFSLRRSLGATRRDIALLVLAESMMIGLLGALVASGVCWGLYSTVAPAVASGVGTGSFPIQACLVGLGVGAAAGALGGAMPAVRASRLPIAVVMRA